MERAFWNGCEVEVVGSLPASSYEGNDTLIRVVRDFSFASCVRSEGYEHLVRRENLAPLCSQVFKIGESVESKVGCLTGKVVAYEMHTNRVIVVSDKINNYNDTRTRYAYALKELTHKHGDDITLKPGKRYKINGEIEVLVMKNPNKLLVDLFDTHGNHLYTVPKANSRTVLNHRHGIRNIQQMNK